jgi:hypothetical protein
MQFIQARPAGSGAFLVTLFAGGIEFAEPFGHGIDAEFPKRNIKPDVGIVVSRELGRLQQPIQRNRLGDRVNEPLRASQLAENVLHLPFQQES